MKITAICMFALGVLLMNETVSYAEIKWVSSSKSKRGGYYRDTSNDGNPYNNANYLGYND